MSLEEIPLIAELEGQPVELPPETAIAPPEPQRALLWPYTFAPTATALAMPISVVVMRSASRRKCSSCHRRRIVYWLEATSGWHGSSPVLCSICSGLLVHGGRHTDEEITP